MVLGSFKVALARCRVRVAGCVADGKRTDERGGTQSGAVRKSGGCEEAAENGKLTSTSFSVKRIISPWSINFRSGLRCAAKGDESETGRRGVLGSNWAELHASMRGQQLTGYPAEFESFSFCCDGSGDDRIGRKRDCGLRVVQGRETCINDFFRLLSNTFHPIPSAAMGWAVHVGASTYPLMDVHF